MTSAALHVKHMCRELPKEILVFNVLPCLPMASLCRCRVVCKTWNALLNQSDFAAQYALKSPIEEFVFITFQSMKFVKSLEDWNVLDVANSKVFSLSHEFLATQASCGNIPGQRWKLMAADGGLLVIWYGNYQDHFLIVCNPLLKAVKVIPSLHKWALIDDYCKMVMCTDTVSMEYEIVVFCRMHDNYHDNCMCIYESKTDIWRKVVNTSAPPLGSWYEFSRFVKFNSALYWLYQSGDNRKPCLVKLDKVTFATSVLDFLEPFLGDRECILSALKLVVSQGRLFCLYRLYQSLLLGQEGYWEIIEVFPEQRRWESLVRMSAALMYWLDGRDLDPAWNEGLTDTIKYNVDPVVPIVCASSILFFSCVGRFLTYEVKHKSWHQFSYNRPLHPHKVVTRPDIYFQSPPHPYCSNFGLSLCPP